MRVPWDLVPSERAAEPCELRVRVERASAGVDPARSCRSRDAQVPGARSGRARRWL